ncbi:MAG: hypothetical protein HY980_03845 [Candidatus Magasanikbacteria bacterium]|nr:hypothetical protein [Candidatus Magasanikbacteria bacterium]
MARLLKQLWKAYANLSGVGLIPVVSDFEHSQLSDLLVGVLRDRRVNADLRQDYLSTLISLNQPTLFWREQLELLRLCRRFKSQQPLFVSPEFARYVKKYFWLNYGYEGPVWQEEDFKERTLWIFNNKDTISAQLKTHELRLINLRREQWELERRLGLSRRELFMFAVARQFMYLKAYRTEARHRFNWASDELFREAGEKLGVSITDFHYATIEEIATLLMGQPVDRSEIKERSRRLLHITEDGRRGNMIKSDKIDDFLSRHIMKDKEDKVVQTSQLLTGQVAFKGKVTGKVKIVTGPKDILKVEAGDVLVALTTNPDVLPAMKKAAAFVTDVGGITSHAAIVAREMEKPCVIGTKIATRVLKDGDIVEVDATHGIIRIIKN